MGKYIEFEKLEVWQLGVELVKETYSLIKGFPDDEKYGLSSQLKRASVSIPANIAEGYGRYHYLEKTNFYLNARGSLFELRSHLLIAKELNLINTPNLEKLLPLVNKLGVKLNNLITSTREKKED
ncbi:MAG: four helix bundle protein [Candidatus Stahlbacteria bacterium]|nr:four helix bundle protein [Candidatus Stahlbacteria bacterium]